MTYDEMIEYIKNELANEKAKLLRNEENHYDYLFMIANDMGLAEPRTIQNSTDYAGIIDDWKARTSYFGIGEGQAPITKDSMYDMLRWRDGYGEAETQVIIASLMLCGAKLE